MTVILNPVAMPRAAGDVTTPSIAGLAGRTVGILTNHWKSMDRMAVCMTARLKDVYRAAGVRLYDIPINGAMAVTVKTAALAECDAVIVGLAN